MAIPQSGIEKILHPVSYSPEESEIHSPFLTPLISLLYLFLNDLNWFGVFHSTVV